MEELKRLIRKRIDAPNQEAVWRGLKRRGYVNQVLDSDDPYGIDDLIDEAEFLADDQRDRDALQDTEGRGKSEGRGNRTREQRFRVEGHELSPYERERAHAQSALHAAEAAARRDVRSLRELPPPQRGQLGPRNLYRRLAKSLPWTEDEAERFVLTGEYPIISPLTGTLETGKDTKITITAEPFVSADTVRRFYLHVMGRAEGRKVKQEMHVSAAVLRFVLEQILQEGKRPSWAELTRRWNAAYPKQRFEGKGRDALSKACVRAYRRIAGPINDRRGYTAHLRHFS
jgi:hypothetical protein